MRKALCKSDRGVHRIEYKKVVGLNRRPQVRMVDMKISATTRSGSDLMERLIEAAKTGVSAHELHEQRVSFIVSAVSDDKTKVTSQMVEAELRKLNGQAA